MRRRFKILCIQISGTETAAANYSKLVNRVIFTVIVRPLRCGDVTHLSDIWANMAAVCLIIKLLYRVL